MEHSALRNKGEAMGAHELITGDLRLRISTKGGVILGLWWGGTAGEVPLLRPAISDDADAAASGCYPLVPFGNRVAGNRFSFGGNDYTLKPNTDWDEHYLHGDGWQGEWTVANLAADAITLTFEHRGGHTPYEYRAEQVVSLTENQLEMKLSVENCGERAMLFGLGWHPFFPLTPRTTLLAPAGFFRTEADGWLPGERAPMPADLDFSSPSPLPHRWVNNGLEDWSGEALISWPERHTALAIKADRLFRHAFVFVSDTSFDPDFKRDYFCFEPMSHLANGHNLPGLGDLQILKPGENLSGSIRLQPQNLGIFR
ncbi:aldose 1-epimerase [Brucella sp. IR073]|uniref:aldose 1-epimerase n=1 Tax=unclassified Brucella TaxID=2632610 RepID=UPI003B98204B